MLPAALAAALVIAARLPCPSASPYTCLSLRGSSGTIVSCLKGEETGRLHPTPSSLASEAREASSLSRTGCPQPFECAKTNQANWAHRLRVWSFLLSKKGAVRGAVLWGRAFVFAAQKAGGTPSSEWSAGPYQTRVYCGGDKCAENQGGRKRRRVPRK